MAYKVDLLLGLQEDLDKAFTPSLYLAMRQTTMGYPEDWPEKDATVKVCSCTDFVNSCVIYARNITSMTAFSALHVKNWL